MKITREMIYFETKEDAFYTILILPILMPVFVLMLLASLIGKVKKKVE